MEHTLVIPDVLFEKIEKYNIKGKEIDEICLEALHLDLNDKKRKKKRTKRKRKKTYRIDDMEFTIKKVDKDGHCFFSVIEIYTNESVKDIRERVSDFMQQKKEKKELENFYEKDEHKGDSYDEFVEKIRSTNEWADQLVIQATQIMLERPIKIYKKNSDEPDKLHNVEEVTIKGTRNEPIFMIYNGKNHYNALIKKSKHDISESEERLKENVKDDEMVNGNILIIEDDEITEDELKKLTIPKLKDFIKELNINSNKKITYKSNDRKAILIKKILDFVD